MTAWFVFSIATVVVALLAYLGLSIWAWRTSDGPGWRSFCLVATCDLGRTACWLSLLAADQARYFSPLPAIKLVLVLQFLGAIFTCALAFALRRAWILNRARDKRR